MEKIELTEKEQTIKEKFMEHIEWLVEIAIKTKEVQYSDLDLLNFWIILIEEFKELQK